MLIVSVLLQAEELCRQALNRRYRLLPHFYTLFYKAHLTGLPVATPLFFAGIFSIRLPSFQNKFGCVHVCKVLNYLRFGSLMTFDHAFIWDLGGCQNWLVTLCYFYFLTDPTDPKLRKIDDSFLLGSILVATWYNFLPK